MNKEKARFNMIEQQIRPWGIHQANVLDLMSSLPREVFVPDDPEFITAAETRFKSLNLHNIQTEVADITQDWQPNNLYDAISITAALSSPPNDYLNLLNPGGRLFCVEGKLNNQYAKLYTCQTKGKYSIQSLFEMSTPNLINESAKESFVF